MKPCRDCMRTLALALVLLLFLVPTHAFTAQGTSEASLRAFADSIYGLLDAGKYAELYGHFHASMKGQVSQSQWVDTVTGVMQRTGPVVSRRFKEHQTSIGAHVIRYDSQYQNGKATDELFIVDEGGMLSVTGIFVRPAL